MSKTAKTIFIYSFYLFCMGAGLLIAPNLILPLFGFEAPTEIWIRMLGLFTFVVGVYYLMCAQREQKGFFRASVYGRLLFFAGVVVMVLGFGQPLMLLGIGSVDLLGAAWTYYHLSQSKG